MAGVILPLILIVVALVTAAVAAYGTAAEWASRWGGGGLDLIYFSRRIQWPLFTVCFLSCVALLLLVISGKRRVWWLIGLAPVLALFAHRFATSPTRDFRVAENPTLVSAAQLPVGTLRDEEWVVGLVVGGTTGPAEPQAYPYAALWRTPVVIQTAYDQRFILLWNPFANFARAAVIDRDVSPRELEVVSMPVNALLVYNARYGQFINGITGLKPDGTAPTGFGRELPVQVMSWSRWRAIHPATKVLAPPPRSDELATAAAVPLRPRYAIPPTTRPTADPIATAPGAAVESAPIETPVVLIRTTTPMALLPTDISDTPINLSQPTSTAIVFRESKWGRVRAFSRRTEGSELRMAPIPEFLKKLPGAAMVDFASASMWSETGRSVESTGPFLGRALEPIPVFEGGYFEVLSYWIPTLKVHHVTSRDFAEVQPPPPPPPATRPARTPATPARKPAPTRKAPR